MGTVYLIPSLLHEEGLQAIPSYLLQAALDCQVFFVENERTARRFLKKLDREFVIDNYEWHTMEISNETNQVFKTRLQESKNIGIISEAGCPGIADPGQVLVAMAQQMNAIVKPLTGPNSIVLALMASGLNGQQFRFAGYLPIDHSARLKMLRDLEALSAREQSTQIFIETPYRNRQLLEAILTACNPNTRLCIAVDLTASTEWVKTKTLAEWKKHIPEIHKRPAIFLLGAFNN